ncbi:MAG: transglutaminase family protein [Myxococcaceae bacterium]
MRLLIQHRSRYVYPRPAALGPHLVRLRPASHARARVETYGLTVEPEADVRWQQDPNGNHLARVVFARDVRLDSMSFLVEVALDLRPVNPFDFLLEEAAESVPLPYSAPLLAELGPFLARQTPALEEGGRFRAFDAELPRAGPTLGLLTGLNQAVNHRIRYVVRSEPGVWTPEQTLEQGRGSCRDSAMLLVALFRSRGLAARFVSGYLVQLADEGMLPDQPRGVSRDVVDLHAWAEVFLPGAGWIGFDATSGLLCGEGHIPLACASSPAMAAPVEGTSDTVATDVSFELSVTRLGHEVRPNSPFPESVYQAVLGGADRADALLKSAGLHLTTGGEPTFNSREHPEAAEWNGAALGPTKWTQGLRLCAEIRARLMPGAAFVIGQGKHYPGESLPRWSLEMVGVSQGEALWTGDIGPVPQRSRLADAKRFAEALAGRLGVAHGVLPAFEDPWHFVEAEASLAADVDPLKANLSDPEERRRLARVLSQGLGQEAGYVLPLARLSGTWVTDSWRFRRRNLFLVPGDAPMGTRLPLASLPPGYVPEPEEEPVNPRDPRRAEEEAPTPRALRTALCVEVRDGTLFVFLPPLATGRDFVALVREVDAVRSETGLQVQLEGYLPPRSALLQRFAVTPDPGVLEANLPPSSTGRAHAALLETTFEAALHAGLHTERYLLNGRIAGSGGGHHLTLGGPKPLQSPLLARPELLASLITFCQHHPSLSYLFTGLFVGPTSQAPRVDEARHDALYELEIALAKVFESTEAPLPPWRVDGLFRHLLVDVSGNTHRAELCIDKLFDWRTPHGRQGLVELRAFEMPPHPRLAVAQAVLVRALVAGLAQAPYRGPLVRWGTGLHDRFLLPYWMWRDFEEVLEFLSERGIALPKAAYRPFLELRCPVAGRLDLGGVVLEVRDALEPWPVLGEEPTTTGTTRYVDSSVERVEVRVEGLVPERHQVLVNGVDLPLHPTGRVAESVAGVRFRAWAPPHSLHPHLGVHHPLRFDVIDTWGQRSLGACGYHVWHAEGRAFDKPPLTASEAEARRAQRFTVESPLPWPVSARKVPPSPEAPFTLDLRRFPGDHPLPEPTPDTDAGAVTVSTDS